MRSASKGRLGPCSRSHEERCTHVCPAPEGRPVPAHTGRGRGTTASHQPSDSFLSPLLLLLIPQTPRFLMPCPFPPCITLPSEFLQKGPSKRSSAYGEAFLAALILAQLALDAGLRTMSSGNTGCVFCFLEHPRWVARSPVPGPRHTHVHRAHMCSRPHTDAPRPPQRGV